MTRSVWPQLIREIMAEQGVSQRRLAIISRVNRSTLRRIIHGETTACIDHVERVLAALGHELDAFPHKQGLQPSHSQPHQSGLAAASSHEANAVGTCSNTTESAKLVSTKPVLQPEIAATRRNGRRKAKPTSKQIRLAAAAARPQPSSTTSSPIEATSGSFGHGQTGNPSASPVIQGQSSGKNVGLCNRLIIGRIAATFHQVAA